MNEATRRQILADMGITRWRLRAAQARGPREVDLASVRESPAAPVADQGRWSVLSLALGDAVLLVDGESSRRDLRLAQDVLAAATGDWRKRPAARRFHWPPDVAGGGVQPAADAGRRALNAFVDKDLGDHAARLLVCTEPLAPRLEESWPGCRRLVIPALDVLGREAAAKRSLWRILGERRR
jgi:hypothetical protein